MQLLLYISYNKKLYMFFTSLQSVFLHQSQPHSQHEYTVDGERFAGLNIRGFSTIEVIKEILSCCLGHKYSLLKKDAYIMEKLPQYSWKWLKMWKFSPVNLFPFTVPWLWLQSVIFHSSASNWSKILAPVNFLKSLFHDSNFSWKCLLQTTISLEQNCHDNL